MRDKLEQKVSELTNDDPSRQKSSMRPENQSSVSQFLLLGLPIPAGQQDVFFTLFLGMYLTTVLGNLLIRLDSPAHAHPRALQPPEQQTCEQPAPVKDQQPRQQTTSGLGAAASRGLPLSKEQHLYKWATLRSEEQQRCEQPAPSEEQQPQQQPIHD
ncbi:hypothetical protein QTO34_005209 [Cnephaeus nilssonii]|uniref:Uncharacterized protein n=1 Tax=Cnephaeus nilssonii TaxID=3371016 RepID=A0AA40HMY6_CNENI|nr:hypothetical protein QTO34_005209 [Eptesicus nilssonii]